MEKRLKGLRIYNTVVGLALFAQGLFMWFVSNDTKLPITTLYLRVEEAGMAKFPTQNLEKIAELKVGPLEAIFLLLSGLFLLGSAFV